MAAVCDELVLREETAQALLSLKERKVPQIFDPLLAEKAVKLELLEGKPPDLFQQGLLLIGLDQVCAVAESFRQRRTVREKVRLVVGTHSRYGKRVGHP